MREILFKAKRIDNGDWEFGYYCHIGAVGSEKHYIIPTYASAFYGIEIDPATLCQYTGLTDKNGVKIFEGDIVSTDIARPYLIVEYRNGAFMANCNDGGKDYYDIFFSTAEEPQTVYKYGEVIGSIHDTPELANQPATPHADPIEAGTTETDTVQDIEPIE